MQLKTFTKLSVPRNRLFTRCVVQLSQFPPTKFVEVKISGFDDSEDGRLNLFGMVNGAIQTEVGYPQLIADFDTAEPYDWGN